MKYFFSFLILALFLNTAYGQSKTKLEADSNLVDSLEIPIELLDRDSFNIFPDDTELYVNFPGGDIALKKFLIENIIYPDSSKKAGVQGVIYVRFLINEEGKILNIELIRGISSDINKEALRVISLMPNWVWDNRIEKNKRRLIKTLGVRFKL